MLFVWTEAERLPYDGLKIKVEFLCSFNANGPETLGRGGVAAMSVRVKLDHFGLYVKDMERTIRWYHEVLGFRLSDYLPPGNTDEPAAPDGIAWLRYGDLHHDLTIVQYPPEALADDKPRRASNLQQLAYHLAAEEEVEAAYKAVTSAGIPIVSPLKRGPLLGILQFYMADPDGNKIEVFSTPGLADKRLSVKRGPRRKKPGLSRSSASRTLASIAATCRDPPPGTRKCWDSALPTRAARIPPRETASPPTASPG